MPVFLKAPFYCLCRPRWFRKRTWRRVAGRSKYSFYTLWRWRKKGYTIEETVYQYDNAATVAFAAGLETPQAWIGRPVKSAFIGYDKPVLKYKRQERIAQPVVLPDNGPYAPPGGLFTDTTATVILKNPNNTGKIIYTTDGSEPSQDNGREYKAPFKIDSTTLIRAIVLENGEKASKIAEGNYRILHSGKNNGVNYGIFFSKI